MGDSSIAVIYSNPNYEGDRKQTSLSIHEDWMIYRYTYNEQEIEGVLKRRCKVSLNKGTIIIDGIGVLFFASLNEAKLPMALCVSYSCFRSIEDSMNFFMYSHRNEINKGSIYVDLKERILRYSIPSTHRKFVF